MAHEIEHENTKLKNHFGDLAASRIVLEVTLEPFRLIGLPGCNFSPTNCNFLPTTLQFFGHKR